jgi:DNA-binding GntR family transcriptional regulator
MTDAAVESENSQVAGQLVLPRTRATAVADELRRRIQAGDLKPGARLRQAEIAKQMGVSTTPVREAFSALAREGLLRQVPHLGVIVFTLSRSDLSQNYEIRIALEPLATRIAVPNLSAEQLDDLEQIVIAMRGAFRKPRYGELNMEFHSKIYAAAERPRLNEIISTLREEAARYMRIINPESLHDPGYWKAAQAEHEQLMDALRRRAPARAAQLMAGHLERSAEQLARSVFPEDKAQQS